MPYMDGGPTEDAADIRLYYREPQGLKMALWPLTPALFAQAAAPDAAGGAADAKAGAGAAACGPADGAVPGGADRRCGRGDRRCARMHLAHPPDALIARDYAPGYISTNASIWAKVCSRSSVSAWMVRPNARCERRVLAGTQTDDFLPRPPTPRFVPPKRGVDAGTQVVDDELFDFDFEVGSGYFTLHLDSA